jgi:hypothetical protein
MLILFLKAVSALNSATVLPTDTNETVHDCIQPLGSNRPAIEACRPWDVTAGSGSMKQGHCKAGYALVEHQMTIEAESFYLGLPHRRWNV